MARGKPKPKLKIGYNFRTNRFYNRTTGRFVTERIAAGDKPAQREKLIIEDLLEEYGDLLSDYFDDISEFRKFGAAPKRAGEKILSRGKPKERFIPQTPHKHLPVKSTTKQTDIDLYFEILMEQFPELMDEEMIYG